VLLRREVAVRVQRAVELDDAVDDGWLLPTVA
jgi:hypothetical protein